ncbi:hypothetical protein T10_10569 [Trichinella papuae]|uniref:Uncharacterized protein n=1 Tax=Trichinella papuae TaxID=268474 RepID=A0A0V1LY39_9BILA|nr:hypothetical protein T10_10569 [Trichinella papuae]
MAAATRLTLNLLPTASNFFSRLKYFPEGKHRPFLNVVQYQADPRQMVVQARYQMSVFSKTYANFYRIHLGFIPEIKLIRTDTTL